ncbi:MAG: alpha/beta hydrolase [Acidimicrobiales bacterium]
MVTEHNYRTFDVAVAGGSLRVASWGEGPVILAAHGITANHRSWPAVAARLDGYTLVAPDLRGRGGSAGLPGPFGMGAHADDLAAVLDHLDVEKTVIAGHSMGAFVSTVMAQRHGDRLTGVVLIDGGVPLAVPQGLTTDQLLQAVIGPAMDRLAMTFETRDAYRDFWKAHPAFTDEGAWSELVEAYVDYDLVGEEGAYRSGVAVDAIRADTEDTLVDDTVATAFDKLAHPTTLLWAPRGLLNQTPGLYPEQVITEMTAGRENITPVLVDDVNHYTITMIDRGAAATAGAIRAMAEATLAI